MRLFAAFACVAILAAASPVRAQAPSIPDGVPSGQGFQRGGMGMGQGGGQNPERRQCVMSHLGGLKEEVMQHMMAFRQANPGASQETRKAERRSVLQGHRPEIAAAIQACGGMGGGRGGLGG